MIAHRVPPRLRARASAVRLSAYAILLCAGTVFSQGIQQYAQNEPAPPPHIPYKMASAPGAPISGNSGPASSLTSTMWTALGPASLTTDNALNAGSTSDGLTSGRITGIAVDPTSSSTVFIATAGGGVWKTTNGGTSWTPLTDSQPTLSMGAIAIAPSNHLMIYAGTGEANNLPDSFGGEGVLVSNDGGSTWTMETGSGALTGLTISQIAVDPTDADTAYAAVGDTGVNGYYYINTGIYKTTDGGVTWTNVTSAVGLPNFNGWTAVVVDPNTPSIVYGAMGDGYNYNSFNGVYRSTDSGSTWAQLTNAPMGSSNSNVGRISLAVSSAAKTAGQHTLYVAIASADFFSSGLLYFGRSNNADATTPTFTELTSDTPDFMGGENSLGGQGRYDNAINVDAAGVVYASGVENATTGKQLVIKSTNQGVSWTDISDLNGFEPHSGSHAIAFDSTNRMFLGGDGGIFLYTPTASTWTDLNSDLNTTLFNGIGLHPSDIDSVVGGSEDNGTELYNNALEWQQTDGGDGGFTQFSPTDASVCYAIHPITTFGVSEFFRKSTDGCETFTSSTNGISAAGDLYGTNYVSPFIVDATNGNHLLLGTDSLYETTDGASQWNTIGTPNTNGFNLNDVPVDTVAMSPANGENPEVVYVSSGGLVQVTGSYIVVSENDGGTWTEHDLPSCTQSSITQVGCRVSQIIVDPSDVTGYTAIAVTSTFSSSSSSHVFRTANAGTSWIDITSNLPNQPTWSAQIDTDPNKTLYVATDHGVYSSVSPYSTWKLYGTGLPNAQGFDLELNRTLGVLGVATHGRGAWEILTPAHITSVTSTEASGTYGAGTSIPIVVNFSAAVTVTGTPKLTLNTSPAATATYSSGSGTKALTFAYTVAAGQTTSGNATGGHLDYASASALSLNGGTIEDAHGVAAIVTLYAPGSAGSLSASKSIVISNGSTPPSLTSPTSSPLSGSTKFTWSPGSGSSMFALWVGTTQGTYSIYTSGHVANTVTSETVTIPANGATLWVRLWYELNSIWDYKDYAFSEGGPPALTAPASSPIGGPTKFTWNAGSVSSMFALWIGTTQGTNNIYTSGHVANTVTSETVTLPANGAKVYVRLWYEVSTAWDYRDYTFTEAQAPSLTSPTSSPLSGSTKFAWSAGTGSTMFALWIGTTQGSSSIYTSGHVASSVTSETVTIPANGATIYVRLWYELDGNWLYKDYTFTEAA